MIEVKAVEEKIAVMKAQYENVMQNIQALEAEYHKKREEFIAFANQLIGAIAGLEGLIPPPAAPPAEPPADTQEKTE